LWFVLEFTDSWNTRKSFWGEMYNLVGLQQVEIGTKWLFPVLPSDGTNCPQRLADCCTTTCQHGKM